MKADDLIKDLPEQFHNKTRIDGLAYAFGKQMDEITEMFESLQGLMNMSDATGLQLDQAGNIVCLTRAESALYCKDVDFDIIDDERYRLFLKYKALRNSTQCTYDELIAGCKVLFNADPIYYSEDPTIPASFNLSVGIDMDEQMLEMIRTSDLSIRASGVSTNISVFAKEFFGFSDTNRYALGFGVGKFAQEV